MSSDLRRQLRLFMEVEATATREDHCPFVANSEAQCVLLVSVLDEMGLQYWVRAVDIGIEYSLWPFQSE